MLLEVVVRAVEAQVELVGFEESKPLTHGRGHDAVRLSLRAPQLDNRVVIFWLVDVEAPRGREELGDDGLGVGDVGLERALLRLGRNTAGWVVRTAAGGQAVRPGAAAGPALAARAWRRGTGSCPGWNWARRGPSRTLRLRGRGH